MSVQLLARFPCPEAMKLRLRWQSMVSITASSHWALFDSRRHQLMLGFGMGSGNQRMLKVAVGFLGPYNLGWQRLVLARLSLMEFLDRIAAWTSPPRKHQTWYFGLLAPST